MKALQTIKGLASLNPITRISTLEKITEHFLRRLPREAIEKHLEIPAPLPQAALEGTGLYTNREAMLHVIPKGGEIAEVGTWRGGFSRSICEFLQPRLFHLIDIDFSEFNWSGVTCKFERHEGDSSTILSTFPTESLDWIYVDGDHTYEGARKDIEASHRVLKPGGLMTFNDYTNWASQSVTPYGVARAVNEFVARENYKVKGLAFSPRGNHDLLVQKPH
jgi:SAM-dependent methyltransferase